MAYFSNGEDGRIFESNWCSKCVHDKEGECIIMLLHFVDQSDWKNDESHPMNRIIEEKEKDGVWTRTCHMFIEDKPEIPPLMQSVDPLTDDQLKEITK